MKLGAIFVAGAIALSFLSSSVTKGEDITEPPSSKLISMGEMKEFNDILHPTKPSRTFTPGESLVGRQEREAREADDRDRERQRLERSRKVAKATQGTANGYYFGWCTYYVAQQKGIPSGWGNAKYWLASAQRNGVVTGASPRPGAIIVTAESINGHVALVQEVTEDTIIISEMNGTAGWDRVDTRQMAIDDWAIRGYIYF